MVSATARRTLPASVVVPSRDRPKLLGECVQSILAGEQLPRELVILDQSAVQNRALAELGTIGGCRVRYQHSNSTGVSAARNEACEIAAEETLVFTDDDVLAAPDWLRTIVGAVESNAGVELISGRVRFIDVHQEGGFAPSLIDEQEPRLYEGRVWTDVLWSNNMAFARTVFDRLGPFDVRLGVGGPYRAATDNDYGFRALEAGYRIRYVPEALVFHQAWRTKKSYSRVQWGYGVGQGAYLTKHIRMRDRYTLIRFRNEVLRSAGRAVAERRTDSEAAKGDAVLALGMLYGSLRWTLLERSRGR